MIKDQFPRAIAKIIVGLVVAVSWMEMATDCSAGLVVGNTMKRLGASERN